MSLSIQNNYGTINHIENSVVTINTQERSVSVRQPSEQEEEVEIVTEQTHFALLTAQCIKEGKAQEVEVELRSAASGSAQKLMECIRTNEALGYIDTKNLSSQALYDELNAYFGLKYSVRNFTKYRH